VRHSAELLSKNAVAGHQTGPVAQARDVVEEGRDLLRAEDHRHLVGLFGARTVLVAPGHLQGVAVEKLDGQDRLIDGFRRAVQIVEQMQVELADIFQIECFGAALEELREARHVAHVVALALRRQVAQLHVFNHPLA
jgi:hypothetical protein